MMKITFDTMKQCYMDNEDFRSFVDKCARTYAKDVDYVLQQPITVQYYQYLNKVGEYDERKSHY